MFLGNRKHPKKPALFSTFQTSSLRSVKQYLMETGEYRQVRWDKRGEDE